MEPYGDQEEAYAEHREAAYCTHAQGGQTAAEAIDDQGPDPVELLFDLQRPEMIEVDRTQIEGAQVK